MEQNSSRAAHDPRPQPLGPRWQRSSYCQGADSTCVDAAFINEHVYVRDSKNPDGPVLRFDPLEWDAFLLGVRSGGFGLPQSVIRRIRETVSSLDETGLE